MSSVQEGYLNVRRYSSIKDDDLARVLKPYKLTLGYMRKAPQTRMTDVALRRMAARGVVKRGLLAKSKKKSPAKYTLMTIADLQKYLSTAKA